MTNAYPGIDVDRWVQLRRVDPDFELWTDRLMPATAGGVEMRPLDETLTRWTLTHIGCDEWNIEDHHRSTGALRRWHTILHTPPCRPEWLAAITPE